MAELNYRLSHSAEGEARTRRRSDAAACCRLLLERFADVPIAGKTPAQWIAASPWDDLRRELNLSPPAWPAGEVEVNKPDTNESIVNRGLHFDVRFGGPSEPFFRDYTVSFNLQQEVVLRDGLGNLQRPMRLADNQRVIGGGYNPYSTLARSCGHLLVICVGTKICALDPWGVSGKSHALLWTQDLTDTSTDSVGNAVLINNGIDPDFRTNPFGPVTARYVSFVRRRNLVVVDPANGEPLWERKDLPRGSEVFGDEQYLLVLAPGSDEATVYRASDGQLLGTRKIPRKSDAGPRYGGVVRGETSTLADSGMDFVGRYLLTWGQDEDDNDHALALFDPWQQKAVWPTRKFSSAAHVAVVGDEAVGVLEPDGHFVLIALDDGRTMADVQLPVRAGISVKELLVKRMGDQYIVVAHDNTIVGNGAEDQMQGTQGMLCYPLRRARIYALDLKGKLAWPAPVDVDHHQLLVSQPDRLPVLLFVAFQWSNQAGQFGQMTLRRSLLAVDRRDGRIVYDDKDHKAVMRGMGVEIHADPAEKTVRVVANNETVTLLFTNKPVKSVVRTSTGVKKSSGKLGEALLDAVKGAVEKQ